MLLISQESGKMCAAFKVYFPLGAIVWHVRETTCSSMLLNLFLHAAPRPTFFICDENYSGLHAKWNILEHEIRSLIFWWRTITEMHTVKIVPRQKVNIFESILKMFVVCLQVSNFCFALETSPPPSEVYFTILPTTLPLWMEKFVNNDELWTL